MKIVCISDLHGFLYKPEDVPECDVVCICGDIVPLDYQGDDVASIAWFCLEFVPWTDQLRCKKVIFIAGNHDFFLEHIMYGPMRVDGTRKQRSASEVLRKLLPGVNKGKHKLIYLRDNSVEIEGKTFYGTPWISDLPNWAFNKTEEELENLFKNVPKKLDVLLTHMPPDIDSVGTVLQKNAYNHGANYSSKALKEAILLRNIHYVFCGHVHSGNHVLTEYNEEHFIQNVSVKDEDYRVVTNSLETSEI